jgi:hypothetical protein
LVAARRGYAGGAQFRHIRRAAYGTDPKGAGKGPKSAAVP